VCTPHTAHRNAVYKRKFPSSFDYNYNTAVSTKRVYEREHEFEFVRVRFNGIGGFNVMMHAVYSVPVEFGVLESLEVRRESSAVFGGHDSFFFFFFFFPRLSLAALMVKLLYRTVTLK
jgi:hypothetical protein